LLPTRSRILLCPIRWTSEGPPISDNDSGPGFSSSRCARRPPAAAAAWSATPPQLGVAGITGIGDIAGIAGIAGIADIDDLDDIYKDYIAV
jgi:hypothetical protein